MIPTPAADDLSKNWITFTLRQWLDRTLATYLAGAALSLIGFVLPWFKIDARAQWSYNGVQLMTNEGLPWIGLIFVGYAVLILGGNWLLHRSPPTAFAIALLAIAVVLGTLVVVSLAAGDALQTGRELAPHEWGIGLFVLVVGHAIMLGSAFSAWILRLLREVLQS